MRGVRKSKYTDKKKTSKGEWMVIGNTDLRVKKSYVYNHASWFDLNCVGCYKTTRASYNFRTDQGFYCNNCNSYISEESIINITGLSDTEIRKITLGEENAK